MKPVLLVLALLLTACGPSPDPKDLYQTSRSEEVLAVDETGCNIKQSSQLVAEHKVGPITNLVKDEIEWGMKNECNVSFDIVVNNEKFRLEGSHTGLEQMASVCRKARDKARKDLLLDLGGNFKSESTIRCRTKETV